MGRVELTSFHEPTRFGLVDGLLFIIILTLIYLFIYFFWPANGLTLLISLERFDPFGLILLISLRKMTDEAHKPKG